MILLDTLYALDSAHRRVNPFPDERQRQLLRVVLAGDHEAREAWRFWQADCDFERDIDGAAFALMGLVFRRVQALDLPTPPELLGRLRGIYRFLWSKNQSVLVTLRRAHATLTAAGLPVMVLKGLATVDRCYGDWGLRLTNDLDLLLPDSAVDAAHGALHAAGWRPVWRPDEAWRSIAHGVAYSHAAGPSVDLHWRPYLLNSTAAAETGLWQRAETVELGGCRVQVPELHDLLVLACFHGRKPMRTAVTRWIVDAHRIVHTLGNPDWAAVRERAAAAGLEQPVGEALRYLHEEYGIGPRPVYRIPRPLLADRLLWQAEQTLGRLSRLPVRSPAHRLLGPPAWLYFYGLRYWLVRRRAGARVSPLGLARHLLATLRQRNRRGSAR